MTKPYLSILVMGRNDARLPMMRASISGMLEQLERHQISSEFILVDWNTPRKRAKLADAIAWSSTQHCSVRVIEVPPKIHRTYKHHDKVPLYTGSALNVAARRAKGKFVLATALDVFFSDELVAFWKKEELRGDALYRINRHNVLPNKFPIGASLDDKLKFCQQNVHSIKEWNKKYPVHTAACGDFILVSRKNWKANKGFPEFHLYGLSLDGLFCYMLVFYEGLNQVVLEDPMRMYHIDHPTTWSKLEREGAKRRNLPVLRQKTYEKWRKRIMRGKHPVECNGENWGLRNEKLVERYI